MFVKKIRSPGILFIHVDLSYSLYNWIISINCFYAEHSIVIYEDEFDGTVFFSKKTPQKQAVDLQTRFEIWNVRIVEYHWINSSSF